jgi:D-xylono/L-arabinono-1,4-lactonase
LSELDVVKVLARQLGEAIVDLLLRQAKGWWVPLISNCQVFAQVPEEEGLPDGLTVDSMGFVWSALWDGSSIIRYTPEGKMDRRITLPAKKVTSLVFGGEELTDIYITSAGGRNRGVEGASAGALCRLSQDVRGVPEFLSKIGL